MSQNYNFDAFISYRTGDGSDIGNWLRNYLTRYKRPSSLRKTAVTPVRISGSSVGIEDELPVLAALQKKDRSILYTRSTWATFSRNLHRKTVPSSIIKRH